jgi:hypothetical protein
VVWTEHSTSAMNEYMKKSLFKDEASEAEPDSKENDKEIDTNIPIEAIMDRVYITLQKLQQRTSLRSLL